MKRRYLSSMLGLVALGGQLLHAQAPAAPAAAGQGAAQTSQDADALNQLKARIAAQQEEIKKLQQAVDEQQKMLEQAVARTTAASPAATSSTTNEAASAQAAKSAAATTDGTAVVTAANNSGPVTLVPAGNTTRPDIVKLPRAMQKDASNIPSPLGFSIGNSTFTPFGFIDAVSYSRSSNIGSGIGTSFGSTPYNNALTSHVGETNITLQNTRLGMRVDSEYKGIKVLGYIETDFIGNPPTSIYQTSNSDTLRMRTIYVDLRKNKFEILAGQDWSLFASNRKGLSPLTADVFFTQAVDTNYGAGVVWARQGQFRFTYHPNENVAMALSFENPQPFIGGAVSLPAAYATQLATQLNNGTTTYTAPNVFPDILAKIAADSKFFHVEVGGMVREFVTDTSAGTPVLYSVHKATGYAGEFNFNVNLNNRFRLLANTFASDGGGRYIGGFAPDLIVRSNGSIAPAHSYSTTDGLEINPTKNTLIYTYYSGLAVSRDTALDANGRTLMGYGYAGSPLSNNKTVQEFTFGFSPTFYKSPLYGAMSLNLQYSYVFRDPWSIPAAGPRDAHMNMFYIDVRYTLP